MTSRPSLPNNNDFGWKHGNTSEKKIEANRKMLKLLPVDVLKENEKVRVTRAKHGLLIKDVVITTRDEKEDQTEFDALLAELRNVMDQST